MSIQGITRAAMAASTEAAQASAPLFGSAKSALQSIGQYFSNSDRSIGQRVAVGALAVVALAALAAAVFLAAKKIVEFASKLFKGEKAPEAQTQVDAQATTSEAQPAASIGAPATATAAAATIKA